MTTDQRTGARPAERVSDGGASGGAASGGGASEEAAVPRLLLDLLAAHGPSGYETDPAAVWLAAAGAFAAVSTDVIGTPLALVSPKHGDESSPKRLLVMGHIDEIGLIVTHIDDDGYLWFAPVGGWDAADPRRPARGAGHARGAR